MGSSTAIARLAGADDPRLSFCARGLGLRSINVLAPRIPRNWPKPCACRGSHGRTIALAGNGTQAAHGRAGGTRRRRRSPPLSLRGVLQYEPRDLTISVEAGLPLARIHPRCWPRTARWCPLDPPFADERHGGRRGRRQLAAARAGGSTARRATW